MSLKSLLRFSDPFNKKALLKKTVAAFFFCQNLIKAQRLSYFFPLCKVDFDIFKDRVSEADLTKLIWFYWLTDREFR